MEVEKRVYRLDQIAMHETISILPPAFTCGKNLRNVQWHLVNLGVVELCSDQSVNQRHSNTASTRTFNVAEHANVLGGDKVDGDTLTTETTATANTMDVVLPVRGQVVVDDKRHLLDIDTPSEQIGGNENTRRARTELLHQDLALLLLHVTVLGIIALGPQLSTS